MGARLSTIPENRSSSVVTATAVPAPCLPPLGSGSGSGWNRDRYQWSNSLNDNKAPPPPVCAYSNTKPSSNNNNNNNNSFRVRVRDDPSFSRAPSVVVDNVNGFATNNNNNNYNNKEVIAFHSSTKWKEYFEASKQSNNLVVIYFTATWCGPCRYMEPSIKEIAAKYTDVEVVKIDVDELFNVSREYGVQAMPTFLLMKKGKQIDKVVGAKKEDLHNKVEKHRAAPALA